MTIDTAALQARLTTTLTEAFEDVSRRMIEEVADPAGNFESLEDSVKEQVRVAARIQGEEIAEGIVAGITEIINKINTNISDINDLETRVTTLATATPTTTGTP
jgi:hypothetical protein